MNEKNRNDSTTLVTNTHNHNTIILTEHLTRLTFVTCDQSQKGINLIYSSCVND